MSAGYTRQAAGNIQPGLPIQSGDVNAEYNQLSAAFDNATGHDHSGSASGVGAPINLASAVTGVLPLANGGTAAGLTASNGGILYSTASQVAILSGTATANQLLVSGSSTTPAWANLSSLITAGSGVSISGTTSLTISATGTTYSSGTGINIVGSTINLATPVAIANGGTNNTSAYTSGSIVFSNGSALTQDNSNLFWDSTNHRLGVGTSTVPAAKVQIAVGSGFQTETYTKTAANSLSWGYSAASSSLYGFDIAANPDSGFFPALFVIDHSNRRIGIGASPFSETLEVTGTALFSSGIKGVTTNSNASAGYIGEYIQSEVTSVTTAASTVSDNATSISLTAGDWDVWGIFGNAFTSTWTQIKASISTASATVQAAPNGGAVSNVALSGPSGSTITLPTGMKRLSLSGTTTVYLTYTATYAGSAGSFSAGIYARRVR